MPGRYQSEQESGGVLTLPREANPRTRETPKRLPPFHVILMDDDDHTYAYVIKMLRELFGHDYERAYLIATEVDMTGRAIVDTTSKERAEFKRDQIHAYGRDPLLDRSAGSMSAIIEPAVIA